MNSLTILITGCSSGIGHDAAFALKKRGHRVIASCRNSEDVARLIAGGLEVVQLDVSDSQSIHTAVQRILSLTNQRVDVLINNAGYGQAGALEDVSPDLMRKQFATNVFGLWELTNLIIPVMRAQGNGRIINISSILGLISLPFRGAYNASKYAVEGLSDTWRLELASSGIKVITIEPGPITSKFRDTSVDLGLKALDLEKSFYKQQYKRMLTSYKQNKNESIFTQSTSAVINQLIHAIEAKKPKNKYLVTIPARVLSLLKRILPVSLLDRLFLYISKHELK